VVRNFPIEEGFSLEMDKYPKMGCIPGGVSLQYIPEA
jgi:hypothetical protein